MSSLPPRIGGKQMSSDLDSDDIRTFEYTVGIIHGNGPTSGKQQFVDQTMRRLVAKYEEALRRFNLYRCWHGMVKDQFSYKYREARAALLHLLLLVIRLGYDPSGAHHHRYLSFRDQEIAAEFGL